MPLASLDRTREAYRQKGLQLSRDLAARLGEGLGENFASLILYGSVARGDHIPGFSGLNLFLIAHDATRVDPLLVRRAITSLADAYPTFVGRHTRRGSLVVVGLASRRALVAPRAPAARGLLDSLTRRELRTSGITVGGEDLLGAIPDEPLRPEDLQRMHERYRRLLGDLEAESPGGRMGLVKAVFNMARACVLLEGSYVVDRADIVREFAARWPRKAGPLRQAEVLRSNWEWVGEAPPVFWKFKADAQRFARATAPLVGAAVGPAGAGAEP